MKKAILCRKVSAVLAFTRLSNEFFYWISKAIGHEQNMEPPQFYLILMSELCFVLSFCWVVLIVLVIINNNNNSANALRSTWCAYHFFLSRNPSTQTKQICTTIMQTACLILLSSQPSTLSLSIYRRHRAYSVYAQRPSTFSACMCML